ALVTGLARRAIEVIKKPLTATIIEEIKLPPPPPPPPPKKIEIPKAPPPPEQPYIPPPDIPPPVTNTEPVIAAPTITPPVEPHVIAPPPPPAPPPPAPKPAIRRNLVPIDKTDPIFPERARRDGVESGKVVARLQVDEKGLVTEVRIVSANPPRVFDREVIRALSMWRFKPEGEKYEAEVEVNFRLE
ncbi:MAG: energy transducer TonB, partial [Betaproteobacteria bacterium]